MHGTARSVGAEPSGHSLALNMKKNPGSTRDLIGAAVNPGISFQMDLISPRFDDHPGVTTRVLTPEQLGATDEVIECIDSGRWKFEWVACPCGAKEFLLVSLQDRFGIPSPVCSCRNCGLLQANPRLNPEASRSFYTDYYRRIYVSSGSSPAELFGRQRIQGEPSVPT